MNQPEHTPDDDKRQALLDAARELFLKNAYSNISIRKIADKARVNSAMIAYYFGSKNGLFREMLTSYIGSNIEKATQSLDHASQVGLEEFLLNFYQTMPPELTHLVLRTVIFERSDMRTWLIDNLMKPAFNTAHKVAENIVDHKGKPVDPLVLRTSMQAMLLAPKLLEPVLAELHPDEINPKFFEKLARFQAQLIAQFFELEEH